MSDDSNKIPRHIAIIMDGNGRWASKRLLPRAVGHERGTKTVQRVIDLCIEHKVEWLTLYAFSTENWGRSEKEVKALMSLLKKYLRDRLSEMMEKNARMHAIGELHMLPEECRDIINETIEATKHNSAINVVLALSYGSRQEIAHAARQLAMQVAAGELKPEDIDETMLSQQLYTASMPDPDLLIRTSGEMRLSNYLLWQISYAEMHVTPTLWPDFGREDFVAAINDYASRKRRFGKR